jgi:hypothetical protein
MPWTLSTSQQPQQQIAESPNCNLPMYKDKVRASLNIAHQSLILCHLSLIMIHQSLAIVH